MPRSKNWLVYPRVFHDFLHQAAQRRMSIDCGTAAEAHKLRGQIYGFFGALEREIKSPSGAEDARILRNLSTQIKLVIEGDQLVAYPADQSPAALLIAKALRSSEGEDVAGDPLTVAPSAAMLELLRKESGSE